MDYPSIENFLAPIYATGASSNDGDYSNPKFDAKLNEAAAAPESGRGEQAVSGGRRHPGQGLPGDADVELPAATSGWSDRVSDVKVTPFGTIDFDLDQGEVKKSDGTREAFGLLVSDRRADYLEH